MEELKVLDYSNVFIASRFTPISRAVRIVS